MKKIRDFRKTIAKDICVLKYCIKMSLNASVTFSLFRLAIEMGLSILPLISMRLSRQIINNLAYGDVSLKQKTILLIVVGTCLLFLNSALGTMKSLISKIHNEKIELLIQKEKFQKSTEIDISYFDSPKYYNDYTNATTNSSAIQNTMWSLYYLLGQFVKACGLIYVFINYSILLCVLLILVSLPFGIIENRFKNKMLISQKELAPVNRRMGYIGSIFTTKNFSTDIRTNQSSSYLYRKFDEDWKTRFQKTKKINVGHAVGSFVTSNFPQMFMLLVTLVLCGNVFEGKTLIGDYTYITGSSQQLLGCLVAILTSYTQYKDNINRSKQFMDFLKIENEVKDEGTAELSTNLIHEIVFKDVFFKYPNTDKNILENISFSFRTNERIAFVGLNGSGKTTIVKLLLRLYDVSEGEILIDGLNIKKYKLCEIRNFFAVMQQGYNKYAFSLRENVALSQIYDIQKSWKIVDALKESSAINVLKKVGDIDTFLTKIYSEEGVELSGGEWQKVALARCFFKDSGMMILDEPSASIDAKSEQEIFDTISLNESRRGVILISHRLSNVKSCDKIFVLCMSAIEEFGTHDELIDKQGMYYELYNLQLSKYL